jgi:antitoxin (DNA-binding transcriptional repressor) of toxin-antitoxin stability system
MKIATVTQLRNDFRTLQKWIEDDERVEITKRGKVIAVLSPPVPPKKGAKKRPDFAARLKRNKVFTDNIVEEDRNSRDY